MLPYSITTPAAFTTSTIVALSNPLQSVGVLTYVLKAAIYAVPFKGSAATAGVIRSKILTGKFKVFV